MLHKLVSPSRRVVLRTCCAAMAAVMAAVPIVARASGPTPPSIAAKAWVLLDVTSQRVLASHNPTTRVEVNELAQLMTAYVTCRALARGVVTNDQIVAPSEDAILSATTRSTMYLDAGARISVGELATAMAVIGARDAAVALAEAVADSEAKFVAMMNSEAQSLGLTGTRFVNASGASAASQYMTAQDIASLAARFIAQCPQQYAAYSQRAITHNKISQQNANRLLWLDPSVDGLAVADSRAAGWSIAASAQRGPRRLIAVVMGAASDRVRAQGAQQLLNFGFQAFDAVRLFDAGEPVRELAVWKGAARRVKAGFAEGLVVAVPRDRLPALKLNLESQQPLLAPLAKGHTVGRLTLSLDGEGLGEYPVVALEEVPLASWLRRTWDAIRLWLKLI